MNPVLKTCISLIVLIVSSPAQSVLLQDTEVTRAQFLATAHNISETTFAESYMAALSVRTIDLTQAMIEAQREWLEQKSVALKPDTRWPLHYALYHQALQTPVSAQETRREVIKMLSRLSETLQALPTAGLTESTLWAYRVQALKQPFQQDSDERSTDSSTSSQSANVYSVQIPGSFIHSLLQKWDRILINGEILNDNGAIWVAPIEYEVLFISNSLQPVRLNLAGDQFLQLKTIEQSLTRGPCRAQADFELNIPKDDLVAQSVLSNTKVQLAGQQLCLAQLKTPAKTISAEKRSDSEILSTLALNPNTPTTSNTKNHWLLYGVLTAAAAALVYQSQQNQSSSNSPVHIEGFNE